MDKLSKSHLPDQKAEDFWAFERSKPKTKHFSWGSDVIYGGKRYTINQTVGRVLVLIDETGRAVRVDNPYYMR